MFYIDKTTWIIVLCIMVMMVKSSPTTGDLSMTWTYSLKQKGPGEPDHLEFIENLHIVDAMFIGEYNHSFALLRWDKTDIMHPTSINLTVRTHNFDGKVYDKTCDIVLASKDETDWVYPVEMTFLRHDRILLTWAEQRNSTKQPMKRRRIAKDRSVNFQVISVASCESSTPSDVKLDGILHLRNFLKSLMILKFEKTFEIISTQYPNEECIELYHACKMVYNYDGLPLINNPELAIKQDIAKYKPSSVYHMNYDGGEGHVFYAPLYYERHIYSPIQGWIAIDPDYKGILFVPHFYSNSSGFATFCWRLRFCNGSTPELRCEWLDGTNNHRLVAKLTNFHFFRTLNSLDGNVILLRSASKHDEKYLVADEVQTNGMCKTTAQIQFQDNISNAQLSFIDRNNYCFSYVTRRYSKSEEGRMECTFTTKCTETSGELLAEPHDC